MQSLLLFYHILTVTGLVVALAAFGHAGQILMIILSPCLILLLRLLALQGSLKMGERCRHLILSQIPEMASSGLLNCIQLFMIANQLLPINPENQYYGSAIMQPT